MELWIRSQNKIVLMKVDEICYAEVYKSEHLLWYRDILLGKYDTKERALEVLDEIQNLLQPKIIYTQKEPIETYELGVYQLKQDVDIKIQEVNRIVYEMPQN